jgi:hypothetical protein
MWNGTFAVSLVFQVIYLLLSGFLPKVVGTEKPDNQGHSPQTGRFRSARVHVWNLLVVLLPLDLGFRFFSRLKFFL